MIYLFSVLWLICEIGVIVRYEPYFDTEDCSYGCEDA